MVARNANIYTKLALFYEQAGLTRYSQQMAQPLLSLAQHHGWAGRSVVDLACGVGTAAIWYAQQGFRVFGVDSSAAMLSQARQSAQAAGQHIDWMQQDMRRFSLGVQVDLALCTYDSLNYVGSMKELEQVFRQVHAALYDERMFLFDMRTVYGLAERVGSGCRVQYDDGSSLLMLFNTRFDYESLSSANKIVIYYRQGDGWQRHQETHYQRSYPISAVVAMLKRAGFELVATYDSELRPFDYHADLTDRVIFITRKPPAAA